MHNAPSVSFPVGRSGVGGGIAAAVWLLGVLATVRWELETHVGGWRLAAAALVLTLGGLAVAWTWWTSPQGTLAWDGQRWSWSSAGRSEPGLVEVCLDFQEFLLVSFEPRAAAGWLWLERGQCVERWDDLRRALYSRARPITPPGAEAGAAQP